VLRPRQWHLAALALVACGRIAGESTDSAADSETGGSTDSTADSETGGADSSGGSGSDQSATGGLVSNLQEPWGPCQREHPGLEPPCGESDVNGLLSGCGLWFDVPLAHVVPPALGLQVVLLPLAPSAGGSGLGGMGGAPPQPLVLDVIYVVPNTPPRSSDGTFDLLEPAGYVRAGDARDDELLGYVLEAQGYGVANVALRQGAETLSVYRGLYSTVEDVCIK
jgi:hypothetical protein